MYTRHVDLATDRTLSYLWVMELVELGGPLDAQQLVLVQLLELTDDCGVSLVLSEVGHVLASLLTDEVF